MAVAAVTLAACGSSAPTKQDVVARANAICSSALNQARGLDQGDASYYAKLSKIVENEYKKLGVLPRPAQDRAVLEPFIDSMSRVSLQYGELATAEHDGDQAVIRKLTAQLSASPAAGYAKSYGLRECSGTSGTFVGS